MKNTSHSRRLLVAMLPLIAGAAIAQETHQLSIPQQPLTKALQSFAAQSGLRVVHYAQITEGRTAPAVEGKYTSEGALDRLLVDSGLQYVYVNAHTVAIRPTGSEDRTARSSSQAEGKRSRRPLVLAQAQIGSQTERMMKSSPEDRAAPALEEVVVTAEKRSESIRDLPISILAVSSETLANRGVEDIFGLQRVAPSLQVAENGGDIPAFTIRGIGTQVSGGEGEPALAVSQDGMVYGSVETGGVEFFDVERVEVLRGPQGTIGGRNANAGAIYIHSKRPTDEFEGGFKATMGNYDRLALEGYLSGPLAEDHRLLGRLAVRTDRASGWITNTVFNQDLGSTDEMQVRASLLARFSDDLEAHLVLEAERDRGIRSVVENGRARPDTLSLAEYVGSPSFDWDHPIAEMDQLGENEIEKYRATLNLAWDLSPTATLTATTGYLDFSMQSIFDGEGTAYPALVWATGDGRLRDVKQFSQEVTLTADLTDRLDVIAGALYMYLNQTPQFILGLPASGTPVGGIVQHVDASLTSLAGYTQWRYRLTDSIRLTAGVRYTRDDKDYIINETRAGVATSYVWDDSWTAWTPRVVAEYSPTEDVTLYASASRGFKSGGIALSQRTSYQPEYIWNYEAGLKANWLDDRLKTALTAFYMDYTDLQQLVAVLTATPPFLSSRIVNANAATVEGVELEFDALVGERFRVTFAGTWLDSTFDELVDADSLFPELGAPLPGAPAGAPNFRDLAGNRLVRAPQWQLNVSGEYRMPLGVFHNADLQGVLRASYVWQDKIYFTHYNHETNSQDAYGLADLSGAIETDDRRWELSAYVRNLMNQEYITGASVAPRGITPVPRSSAFPGRPRTYGISLAHRF